MAILWEQRTLLNALDEIECEEANYTATVRHDPHMTDIRNVHLESQGHIWIYENRLVRKMLSKYGYGDDDVKQVLRIKRLITASIDDGFIVSVLNEKFKEGSSSDDVSVTSPRRVCINQSKGPELTNTVYFWWKYLAGTFPPLTQIGVAAVTAAITSGAIWLFVINSIEKQVITKGPSEFYVKNAEISRPN